MPIKLGIANLRHNLGRTALSVAGIALAIVLVFMQLGFLGSVRTTATQIYDKLVFDLLVRSPDYLHFCDSRRIPRDNLFQIASLNEVEHVAPFQVMLLRWQHPRTGVGRGIIAMGIDTADVVFDVAEIREKQRRLTSSEYVLIDRKSRSDFGPADGRRFGSHDIGVETDIMGKRVVVVEHIELGTGLAANGALILSESGFARVAPVDGNREVSLGLVQLRRGQDPEVAVRKIRESLHVAYPGGSPVDVLTRQEVIQRELKRWVDDTPIGAIFKMGVTVALFVGGAVVYMVLSTDVTNHIREYATLAAIGYPHRYLAKVIMEQALWLAVLAFAPAWAVSELLYRVASQLANIPISMTVGRPPLVFALSLMMCLASGLVAVRKLRQVAPADLF